MKKTLLFLCGLLLLNCQQPKTISTVQSTPLMPISELDMAKGILYEANILHIRFRQQRVKGR